MARHVPSQAGNETREDFETRFVSFTFINPKSLVSPYTKPGILGECPKDTTRTSSKGTDISVFGADFPRRWACGPTDAVCMLHMVRPLIASYLP